MTYPILDNDGRTVLHHAKTADSARRWLTRNLGDHSLKLIASHKFNLHVWLRDPWIADLNGGLVGWMYSIGK